MFQFTRKEVTVLLFLLITFILGSGIRVWQRYFRPLPKVVFEPETKKPVVRPDTLITFVETKSLNINEATQDQLISIPGIGPVLAQRIIDYRELNGSFKTLNDLSEVNGVGPKKQDKISKYLIIE